MTTSGYIAMRWYQHSRHGSKPATSEKYRLPTVASRATTKASHRACGASAAVVDDRRRQPPRPATGRAATRRQPVEPDDGEHRAMTTARIPYEAARRSRPTRASDVLEVAVLADPLQVVEVIEPVDVDHAVEMVELVLERAGQEAAAGDPDRSALRDRLPLTTAWFARVVSA